MPNNIPLIPISARTESIKITSTAARTASPTNKLFTAGSNGSRIERIQVINGYGPTLVTPNARTIRFYILIDGSYYLWKELPIVAGPPTPILPPTILTIPGGFNMSANQEIWVSQSAYADTRDVTVVTIQAKDF